MNILETRAYKNQEFAARGTEKRPSPYCSTNQEYCTFESQKARAVEGNGMFQQFVGKVAAVAYPKQFMGENYMHASLNNGFSEIERSKVNGSVQCSIEESSSSNELNSSVGSCGIISNDLNKFCSDFWMRPSEDTNTYCSDAESCCFGGDTEGESTFPSLAELDAKIHRLELDSYRCTLRGLFTSGPLSWENEEVLTNLRLSLHVSNDEHLMEIKNLISARSYLWIRAKVVCLDCFQGSKDDSFLIQYGNSWLPMEMIVWVSEESSFIAWRPKSK